MESKYKLYDPNYDDAEIRGTEDPRPWNIHEEITRRLTPTDRVLDIGCGTCRKSLRFAQSVKELWGVEPSKAMRDAAAVRALRDGVTNLNVVDGVAERLPFRNAEFDVVCCFIAPQVPSEVHRVLKQGGTAVIEQIGERDKASMKTLFGEDSLGPRGKFLNLGENERLTKFRHEFQSLFSKVDIRTGKWKTFLTRNGLIKLLEQAGEVRNFDRAKDEEAIREVEASLSGPRGIEIEQHRILIVAVK